MTFYLSKCKPQKVLATTLLLYGSMGLQAHALTVGTAKSPSNAQETTAPASSPTALNTIEHQPSNATNLQTGRQVPVKGHVADANGEPIVGATVTQRGTKNATVTAPNIDTTPSVQLSICIDVSIALSVSEI